MGGSMRLRVAWDDMAVGDGISITGTMAIGIKVALAWLRGERIDMRRRLMLGFSFIQGMSMMALTPSPSDWAIKRYLTFSDLEAR